MARGGKKAPKQAATPNVPAWDKATWMSLSNVRLGVPAFVVSGALHAKPAHVKLTEAQVRQALSDWLGQSR